MSSSVVDWIRLRPRRVDELDLPAEDRMYESTDGWFEI
jgi:hypothetical protein